MRSRRAWEVRSWWALAVGAVTPAGVGLLGSQAAPDARPVELVLLIILVMGAGSHLLGLMLAVGTFGLPLNKTHTTATKPEVASWVLLAVSGLLLSTSVAVGVWALARDDGPPIGILPVFSVGLLVLVAGCLCRRPHRRAPTPPAPSRPPGRRS